MMDALEYYTEPLNIVSYILEDDKEDAETIRRIFDRNDFGKHEEFTRGSEVLKILKEKRVHLFIADYRGIDLDGIEVMAKVKEAHERCYFILMTAYVTNEVFDRAINEIQIQHYVDKTKSDCFKKLEKYIKDGVGHINKDFDFFHRMKNRFERINPMEGK